MTTRTRTETVTFRHPFILSSLDEIQPAGHYIIETDEELLEDLSFPAYRRLVTSIHLAGRPHSSELSRVLNIDPAELSAALATDAGTAISAASHTIKSSDVWEAARSRGLYAWSVAELEALITLHCDGPLLTDQVIAEAARHVRDFRKGMGAGHAY
jgi:hypothetical protein